MNIREAHQPDDAAPTPSDDERPDPAAAMLYAVLHGLADGLTGPADLMAGVRRRARRIRTRRRVTRAVASTAALATAVMLGPTLVGAFGQHGGPDEAAAAPPAAVLDLTVAYPEAMAPQSPATGHSGEPVPSTPVNALNWPARGDVLPAEALDLARSYLVVEAKSGGDGATAATAATTAEVRTLWTQRDPERDVWLYAIEGWTTGPKGPGTAEILVGEFTPQPASKAAGTTRQSVPGHTPPVEMTAYSTTIRYTHPAPGTPADPDAAVRIAEYSVWLPVGNRLLVLGAPQVSSVLYSRDGKKYVAQPTRDGVALFQRGKLPAKGGATDLVQVRDDKNTALTPPVGWSTPDLSLTGPGASYVADVGWSGVPGEMSATTVLPASPIPMTPVPTRPTPAGTPTAPARSGAANGPTQQPSGSGPPDPARSGPTTDPSLVLTGGGTAGTPTDTGGGLLPTGMAGTAPTDVFGAW